MRFDLNDIYNELTNLIWNVQRYEINRDIEQKLIKDIEKIQQLVSKVYMKNWKYEE